VLLEREGRLLSVSMVGRMHSYLKKRGVLREPLRGVRTVKGCWKRSYGIGKPKDYGVEAPGDLVQMDTLEVRPEPGVVLKQFTCEMW
jgi:putative transposase